MTLIELQPGTAVDPTAVIGVRREDYASGSTRQIITEVRTNDGRAYKVGVDYDEVLRLLNLTEEEPPSPTEEAILDTFEGPSRAGFHSRACGFAPHNHGALCHRNCPTCGGKS